MASSPGVDGMLFDNIIENSIVLALDDCTVLLTSCDVGTKLLIMHKASEIWIILRSNQLSLHSISNGLISVVSDLGGILDAVGRYAADTRVWIDAVGIEAAKVETSIVDQKFTIRKNHKNW